MPKNTGRIETATLESLLDELRQEKTAASDGIDQRNVEGTDHVSGKPQVTKDDNLEKEQTGARSQENTTDVKDSYPNNPEEVAKATTKEEGNLSQQPMATTTETAPEEGHMSELKKTKDDGETEHPSDTEKKSGDQRTPLEKVSMALSKLDTELGIKSADDLRTVPTKDEIEKAARENPELVKLGYAIAQQAALEIAQEEMVKEACEQNPEYVEAGMLAAQQIIKEAQEGATDNTSTDPTLDKAAEAGEREAEQDLEKLAAAGIDDLVKRASTAAQITGEFLAGLATGQQYVEEMRKKAGLAPEGMVPEEALAGAGGAPDPAAEAAMAAAEGGAAPEGMPAGLEGGAGPEGMPAGLEGGAGPEAGGEGGSVDMAAIQQAIDEALGQVSAEGEPTEEEVAEALAEALMSGEEPGVAEALEGEIGQAEKAAAARASDPKIRQIIRKKAAAKLLQKKGFAKRALAALKASKR